MATQLVYAILSLLPAIIFCAAGAFSKTNCNLKIYFLESPCTTPNGESATCKDLTDCDVLVEAVGSKDQSLVPFLKASSCGFLMVCCGASANFTEPKVKPSDVQNRNTTMMKVDKKELLADKRYCGYQHADDYYRDETISVIYEFPWLFYISLYKEKYESFNQTYELRCAGVMINTRYGLTAAECNAIPFDTVQIGQHDRFKNVSCDNDYNDDCNEPFVTAAVEEKFTSNNGILLFRLAKPLEYNDFIRPICLPLDEADSPKVGDTLVSSGWGDVTLEVDDVKATKKVNHVLKDLGDEFIYVNSMNYTNCFGDEGGPLMHNFRRNAQWFVNAIIPPYFCLKNTPARRINQATIDWILENIHP